MPRLIDPASIRFAAPQALWLLLIPAIFGVLWLVRLVRYRRDARAFRSHRRLPVRERLPIFGGLLFWLCAILALTLTIVALARPGARIALRTSAGVDIVILQDGSASMHVADVRGDRWQRSIAFLRVLAESLQWKDDRMALALFAHIAAPQIRLTNDPNTFFFFLDHLDRESPFPLKDDTTWDTNIESGVYWGLRLLAKDQEIQGPSPNGQVFVLISDGQAWSGQVENALRLARARSIPVFVVGVGTTAGGLIPEPPPPFDSSTPIHAVLDRQSLLAIAAAGAGEYFELDREEDRSIAQQIIAIGRRRAGARAVEYGTQDLYWPSLFGAAVLAGLAVMFLRERVELALAAIAALASLAWFWTI